MPLDFLGRAWRFPVAATDTNQIAMADYEQAVQQSIWIILGTAPGERAMRPDFGCGLHELVFANNSAATLSQAAGYVREALLRWEPRIEVISVTVTSEQGEAARLLINLSYRIRATNNRFNLVYPFYLER